MEEEETATVSREEIPPDADKTETENVVTIEMKPSSNIIDEEEETSLKISEKEKNVPLKIPDEEENLPLKLSEEEKNLSSIISEKEILPSKLLEGEKKLPSKLSEEDNLPLKISEEDNLPSNLSEEDNLPSNLSEEEKNLPPKLEEEKSPLSEETEKEPSKSDNPIKEEEYDAKNVHYEGETAIYTDPKSGYQYKWCGETNQWLPKTDITYGFEDDTHTYTDTDGVKYFWDKEKNAWFPKIDDEFMARYQMSYGFVDNTTPEDDKKKEDKKKQPASEEMEEQSAKEKSKGVKRKTDPPPPATWFEMDDQQNTKVYVNNLPTDITEEEFVDLMQKCGLVMRDVQSGKMKIKLYTVPDTDILKGDALCTYIKIESVELALNLLDGYLYRGKRLTVERAKFQMKGAYDPTLKPKKKRRKDKDKIKKMQEKLFDWRPEKMRGERSKHERVVIVKNLFEPSLFDKDVSLILEFQQDLREECGKCGEVKRVVLYDRHPEGVVQITMKDPEEADEVVNLLNGRWFNQRQLTAQIWDGKTKFKIAETDAQISKRLETWEEFLESEETADKLKVKASAAAIEANSKNTESPTLPLAVSRAGAAAATAAATKTEENQNQGRSSGQTPWTHSSDVHIIRGQNLPRRKNQRPINTNNEDNIGEVIQDRFNPKPWFGYEPSNNNNNNKGPTYIPPQPSSSSSSSNQPSSSQDLTVPFDSFPLSLKPNVQDSDNPGMNDDNSPPKNTYGSMYTSYDPPPALNQKNPDNFVTYEPPAKNIKPPKYLPPEPDNPPENPSEDPPESPPENPKYMPQPADLETDTDNGPPISQTYNHPYHHHHHHQDTIKIEEDPKFPGLPAYLDHDPNEEYKYYNYHHQLHHYPEHPPIYHEIKTTTEAAPAAEDQRLNKKPYSYYYLGRKLWYIPLYFSVYFIIYIFVLILKSIARHKITFNHYFEDDKREMKDVVTPVPVPHHVVHELGDHVWDDIHAARRKYIM